MVINLKQYGPLNKLLEEFLYKVKQEGPKV